MGHFLACKLFHIATPVFSIGFGPTLAGVTIGTTFFQIAALPLGGYVSIATAQLDAQPYFIKAIVLLAGVVSNILFAYVIFAWFKMRSIDRRALMQETTQHVSGGIMGPIGIISLISYSLFLGYNHFLLLLGGLSYSIGIFNLLPVPFLDGGQLAVYTIEAFTGPISDSTYNIATLIFLCLFILFMLYITVGDMRSLRR